MTASESLRAWAPCLIAAAMVFAWHYWPRDPASTTAPSRPSRTLTGYGIVVGDFVRACNHMDGCVTFRGGMKVIIEGHASSAYLIRRIATEPAYWIPDRSIELERAP